MRLVGCSSYGIRLPIITEGDDLSGIIAGSVAAACKTEGLSLKENDVIGVTEAIVAKAQGNYAGIAHIAEDVRAKFPSGTVGVVFPIMSRNRFINILKGIALGADKVAVLLRFPDDEQGNPIIDAAVMDEAEDKLSKGLFTASEFLEISRGYKHPFTGVNYIELYGDTAPNIEVYVSGDSRDILKITDQVIAAEVHKRERTKRRLLASGAKTVYTLSDILSRPVSGSGFNPDYGVLGSNLSTGDRLKLFPRDCAAFVLQTRERIKAETGVKPELLIYGDGAFKDPLHGIWELADPVVSPGYSERLGGMPNEIKIKYVADNLFGGLDADKKAEAISGMIREKGGDAKHSEGTTPRKYADLLGSLCDLMSGSGDKGTPVVLIKGYFDNFATE